MPLAHLIEINALTLDGADGPRLTANWMWAGALLDEAAVRDLARDLVPGADGAGAACGAARRRRTDAERSCAGRSDARRDRAAGEPSTRRIEDILPLSPLQEGLLFHALYDAQGPDVYTVQLELELEGALDPRRAGSLVAGRGGAAREPAGRVPA